VLPHPASADATSATPQAIHSFAIATLLLPSTRKAT
jgi:hypothetical protein